MHLSYSSSLPYSRDSGKANSEKGSCQPKPQEPFLNLWIEFSPVSRKGLPDHRHGLSPAMNAIDLRVGIRLQMLVDAEKMADLIGDMRRQSENRIKI